MAEELWNEIKQLEGLASREALITIEHRTKLFDLIIRLFQADLKHAMSKDACQVLWKSQKLLFNKIHAQLDRANIKLNERKTSKDEQGVEIAKINVTNVLRTMFGEWSRLATIVEGDSVELLPLSCHEDNAKNYLTSKLSEKTEMRIFAQILYARIGDIMRYLKEYEMSERFYQCSISLANPKSTSSLHEKEHALLQVKLFDKKRAAND